METHPTPSNRPFRKVILPIVGIFLLVLAGLILTKMISHSKNPGPENSDSSQGDVLPNFSLGEKEGKTVHISDIKAKVIVLNFWATWCAPCMNEMPSLIRLRNQFKEEGLEVVGINLDDQDLEEVLAATRDQFDIPFPLFSDRKGVLAELFDVQALPLTVIMNNQRKVLFAWDGENEWDSPEIQGKIKTWLTQ